MKLFILDPFRFNTGTPPGPPELGFVPAVAWGSLTPSGGDLGLPLLRVHESWDGFGTKYADPIQPPDEAPLRVLFTPYGDALMWIQLKNITSMQPILSTYAWSDDGFGAKYVDPGFLSAQTDASLLSTIKFTSDGLSVAFPSVDGGIDAYSWVFGSGFGTKFSAPPYSWQPYSPITHATSVSFNPSSSASHAIALSYDGYEYPVSYAGIAAATWSSTTGFGTKYAASEEINNAVDTTVSAKAITLSSETLFFTDKNSPYKTKAHGWSMDGFGAAYASTGPSRSSTGHSVSNSENAVSGGLYEWEVYPWSGFDGFGSMIASPPETIGIVHDTVFTQTDSAIILGTDSFPDIRMYLWFGYGGFGTKFADPEPSPSPYGWNNTTFTVDSRRVSLPPT